jgi:hypothetical protein
LRGQAQSLFPLFLLFNTKRNEKGTETESVSVPSVFSVVLSLESRPPSLTLRVTTEWLIAADRVDGFGRVPAGDGGFRGEDVDLDATVLAAVFGVRVWSNRLVLAVPGNSHS